MQSNKQHIKKREAEQSHEQEIQQLSGIIEDKNNLIERLNKETE
jgi:hypothetical protein